MTSHLKLKLLLAIIFSMAGIAQTSMAGNYSIANYNPEGSRAIPSSREPNLTIDNIKKKGLSVKWFAPTDQPALSIPIVYKKIVYVGTSNIQGSGSIYAFNADNGEKIWSQALPGGVLASPLIFKGDLYVASLSGTLYKFDRLTGAQQWSYSPQLSSPAYLDSTWSGPLAINNGKKTLIIMTINPNDEFDNVSCGRAGVIAVNTAGQEVWKRLITGPNECGSGIWNASPAYSKKNNLIFVSTGQATKSLSLTSVSSDSVYALDARDGHIVWQNQVRANDIWSFVNPFYPENPKDTDIGDAPALFTGKDGKEYVAMGSKRGIFYVMDALTGRIINDNGTIGDFKKGLDFFNYSGAGAVGNGLDGGYNLDSGYFEKNRNVIHFGILSNYKTGMTSVFNKESPFNNGYCYVAFYGIPLPSCPAINSGNLVLINESGSDQVGVYTMNDTHFFSPVYLNNIIFVTTTNNESTTPGGSNLNRVLAIDVTKPNSPTLLSAVPVTFGTAGAVSGGAQLSVGNGMVYVTNGFFGFGEQQGLYAIGLNGSKDDTTDDDNDESDD